MAWNPALYSAFRRQRLQPALDLLARVALEAPRRVYDLGCGPGEVTRLMAERWPAATITGLDSDKNMLEMAAAEPSPVSWEQGDIADFQAVNTPDLIYSNAALNWVEAHETVFPRLAGLLAPGGILAVQMPRNSAEPSHAAMMDIARAGPWREQLAPLLDPAPVRGPAFYHNVLNPLAARLDIWETKYLHVLEGEDPVVKWFSATALRPFLAALEEPARGRYLAEYTARVRDAYPPHPDGRTLLTLRRIFVLAVFSRTR